MIETWMRAKQKVTVGLFTGVIVRVIQWHGEIKIDVEIGGVINRYAAQIVKPVYDG